MTDVTPIKTNIKKYRRQKHSMSKTKSSSKEHLVALLCKVTGAR